MDPLEFTCDRCGDLVVYCTPPPPETIYCLECRLLASLKMSIEDAIVSLAAHLGEPDVFMLRHDGQTIIVDVNFIYRVDDVEAIGGVWEGLPVVVGRKSCW